MLKKYNKLMLVLFAFVDIALTICSLGLAYLIRFKWEFFTSHFPVIYGTPPPHYFFNPPVLVVISIIWLLVFRFSGLYQPKRGRALIDEWFSIFNAIILSTIILLGLSFFYRQISYSRVVVFIFMILDIILIGSARTLLRFVLRYFRKKGFNLRYVLIAGAGELGQTLLSKIQSLPAMGLEVKGFADDNPDLQGKTVKGVPVLGTLDDIPKLLNENGIDQLYVALPFTSYQRLLGLLSQVSRECVDVKYIPDLLQFIVIRSGVEDLDGLPVVNLNYTPLDGWNSLIKRMMDIVLSLIFLVIALPVMIVLAILIKLTSRGPVLYYQERMGLDGKSFIMYKFRSMIENAEEESGPVWASKDDPRVTWIGRFMRRYSLDELPQLLNVLKGDMSLVGPRPERPPFVKEFKERFPKYMARHKVKSGMTGWAQVNGYRGLTSIEKRIEYDIYYIKNWSIAFDLKILMLTLFRVHLNAI